MKKILLATTILGLSAGFAAADITWGGSATGGIAKSDANGQAPADLNVLDDGLFHTYSSVNLAATMSGTSDSGLTFGATFDVTVGRTFSGNDDGDGFGDEGGFDPMPTVFVEGSFGKLAISSDNYDFYDDTNGDGDVEYTGTFGAISVGVIADVDLNEASAKVGYTAGALAVNANMDTYELWNLDATYTMGAIALTAATDESENSSLKAAFTGSNGITASAKYNTNGGTAGAEASFDLAAGYSANGLSINATADNAGGNDTDGDGTGDDVAWAVSGSYDLGGGLSVEAGTNYVEDVFVGAKMSF